MDRVQIQEKFDELEALYENNMNWRERGMGVSPTSDWVNGQKWVNSAQNLIRCISGNLSDHYSNFSNIYNSSNYLHKQLLDQLRGILKSAKSDYDSGFIFNLESRISGEVLSDLTATAEQTINNQDPSGDPEGRKNVAAVLACAALEDALKRYAALHNINVENKGMQESINALKGAGLLVKMEASHLQALVKIRNSAMHAKWDEINETDVEEVISRTKLVLTKFENTRP